MVTAISKKSDFLCLYRKLIEITAKIEETLIGNGELMALLWLPLVVGPGSAIDNGASLTNYPGRLRRLGSA